MATSIIRFLNIILAGLLAGTSFGIWLGFNPLNLSPATYVEQQQHTILSLNVLMSSLVVLATIVTLLSAFLQRKDRPVFITLLIAALFFIACILISLLGNQPINYLIMSWTADSLPNNWAILRDRWWSLHIMRTIAELIALCLVTWTSIKMGNPRGYH
jgi:hypothetical protein